MTDSPWFWVMLFTNAGLIGIGLIGPKYQLREAMLERRYELRREAAARRASGESPPEQTDIEIDPQAQDRPLLVPLWPLVSTLVVVDVAAVLLLARRRRSSSVSPPVEP